MAILSETVHTHFTATGKSYRVCKICWWGYVPWRTSFAYYWLYPSCKFCRSWAFILWLATNQVISQKQDVWWAVVRTCTHALTSWPWHWCRRNLYNLCNQTQEEDVPRVHPLQVESVVNGKPARNYNVQPRGRGCGGMGCVGEKWFASKESNSPFWTKVWTPPNQKFLDPPLT